MDNGHQIGEISRRDKQGLRGRGRIVWSACPSCGTERWVPAKRPDQLCLVCSGRIAIRRPQCRNATHKPGCRCYGCVTKRRELTGSQNPSWKGGRRVHRCGYMYVLVSHDDPMRSMGARDGYVFEHRLVMARYLNRPLNSWEVVHHRNGNKKDNRIENLELWVHPHPSGAIRAAEYHCPGCRCFETKEE